MIVGRDLPDFYPTPPALIERLVEGISFRGASVLEPSAGRGDICEYIKENLGGRYYDHRGVEIHAIEIDPDLRHVLRGKEILVVHDDFLTFATREAYDYIIANFPFSAGDKHLAHALDLLGEHGGELRCLVNAETLRNPCSALRRRLVQKLADLGADVEYLVGAFEHAERVTSVEVALIKATVKGRASLSFILEGLQPAQESEIELDAPQELVSANFMRAIVAQFQNECEAGIRLMREYYAMRPHIRDSLEAPQREGYATPLIKLEVNGKCDRSLKESVNAYLRGVRKKYWEGLIHDPRFVGQYTSNIMAELDRKLKELAGCDFSLFNIQELERYLQSQVVQGVEEAIMALFDKCSRMHAYDSSSFSGNVHYYNGWCTNKAHKIAPKIILPMYGLDATWSGGHQIRWRAEERLQDIVKVLNYLAEEKEEHVSSRVSLAVRKANDAHDFDLDLGHIRVKFFKKGTAHIWFQDLALLNKFNIFGSQRKGWLPPAYGKKSYDEMTAEERAVVDEFQGREAYEQVMNNPQKYLVQPPTLPKLLAA